MNQLQQKYKRPFLAEENVVTFMVTFQADYDLICLLIES